MYDPTAIIPPLPSRPSRIPGPGAIDPQGTASRLSGLGIRPRLVSLGLILVVLVPLLGVACGHEEEIIKPAYYEVVELRGTPYERGFQHGRHFASKIRSFYTQLLTSAILPWLNREQPDIAAFLTEYTNPLYDNGQFSYQLMLQSGQNLLNDMPESYVQEMQGIADGAKLPFEQVLIINTLLDNMMSMRSITFFLRLLQAPQLLGINFLAPAVDPAGDEVVANLWPYQPSAYASAVELPVNTRIQVTLEDLQGVDPESVRIRLDSRDYAYGHPSIRTHGTGLLLNGQHIRLVVDFTPPNGLSPASVVSFQIQAGDRDRVVDPPPAHARIMRDERIIFTTEGYGREIHEVENRGTFDSRFQPPPLGMAFRNSATMNGKMLAAQHFALLDAGTYHKHTAVFIHHPDEGKSHVMVGWTGFIYGHSGMNSDGLVFLSNISDTQDNSMVGEVLTQIMQGQLKVAKLLSSGTTVGIVGRELLTHSSNVEEAQGYLRGVNHTFGWNIILAEGNREDKGQNRSLAAVEVDANVFNRSDGGYYTYTPDPACEDPGNCDEWDRPWASVGPDDLRIAAHFQKNREDISLNFFNFPILESQRFSSTYYFRSMRAFSLLGESLNAAYGQLNVAKVKKILRTSDFVDQRDSMNAVIYEPEDLRLHFAMGEVPATDAPFVTLDLKTIFARGGSL